MSPKDQAALEHIQNLYVMQFKVLDLLEQELTGIKARQEAHACVREFQKMLRRADWRFMGGEDVYESLKQMSKELEEKLRSKKR